MKAAICACLFVLACKSESTSTPSASDEKPTPVETAAKHAAPKPTLPDQPGTLPDDRARPQLPPGADDEDDDGRDWNDPAFREEMRARREERRKEREAALDTNKDGVVSPEERIQRLKPMVERLDGNGDGKLSVDELASSERRRMQFDDPAAVDTDKNGEISLAELDAAMAARRQQMRERWRGGSGGSGDGGRPWGGRRGGRGSGDAPQ